MRRRVVTQQERWLLTHTLDPHCRQHGSASTSCLNTCSFQSRIHVPYKPVNTHRWRASLNSSHLTVTPCKCSDSSFHHTQHPFCQSSGLASSSAGVFFLTISNVGSHLHVSRCGSPAVPPHSVHSHAQMLLPVEALTSSSSGIGSSSRWSSGSSSRTSTSTDARVGRKAAQVWGHAPAVRNSSSRADRSCSGGNSGSSLLSAWFSTFSSSLRGVNNRSGKSQKNVCKSGSRGSKGTNRGPNKDDDEDIDGEGWQWFSWRQYNQGWQMPCSPGTPLLRTLSSVFISFLVVLVAYSLAGIGITTLSEDEEATFTLVAQLVMTAVTLTNVQILMTDELTVEKERGEGTALQKKSLRPKQEGDDSLGLFRYSLSEPFTAPRGWLAWGLLGVVLSPVIANSVATLTSTFGYEEAVGGLGTEDSFVGSIMQAPNNVTCLKLLTSVGVLAPVLEETLFRGLLLTSLCTYMPTWAAVITSSGVFGLLHFSLRDLPVLFSIAVLEGFFYVRSRNLLTPIIIHGAWNSALLSLLIAEAALTSNSH